MGYSKKNAINYFTSGCILGMIIAAACLEKIFQGGGACFFLSYWLITTFSIGEVGLIFLSDGGVAEIVLPG